MLFALVLGALIGSGVQNVSAASIPNAKNEEVSKWPANMHKVHRVALSLKQSWKN
jgi:hypothetical protein